MSDITQSARVLMAAADTLTGVSPGLKPDEIRAKQVSSTPEIQKVRYLCDLFRKTKNSVDRAEIVSGLGSLVAENASLKPLVNQLLPMRVSSTSLSSGGRPKKHASETIRKREWARAQREKKRGV